MDEFGALSGSVMSSCLSTADVNAVRSTARYSTPTIFGCQLSNPRFHHSLGIYVYITRVLDEESPVTICAFPFPSSIRSVNADKDIGKSQSPRPRG